jgi:homocysteine S-methyltransferase
VSGLHNPLGRFIRRQGALILDGGLATALEARGCDLDDDLWSAKVLLEDPQLIRDVHLDFLTAGADCVMTSTYQATIAGFRSRGLTDAEGEELIRRSVRLAVEARDLFWSRAENRRGRMRPLVAASVGPYGAALADGSEYSGDYGMSTQQLYSFHRRRWHLLAESDADLLGCETIPSLHEVKALLRLLGETPRSWAWISCSCRDGRHVSDGSPMTAVAGLCEASPRVAAVGVNCTAPHLISSLIDEIKRGTDKPILVYPNSGERYDAATKRWTTTPAAVDWGRTSVEWVQRGASGVGGCCRVGAGEIGFMRRHLVP